MTATKAAKILEKCTKIMILTGAGISAASGIPTFRGQDGFWKKSDCYGGLDDPEQILTMEFFRNNPAAVWHWHYDFYELQRKCKPNPSHTAIRDFQEYCLAKKDL